MSDVPDKSEKKTKAPKATKTSEPTEATEASSEFTATETLDFGEDEYSQTAVAASDQPSHGEMISAGGSLLSAIISGIFLYVL